MIRVSSDATRIQVPRFHVSLFVAVEELAKVFNEADSHHDSRSRQADKKGYFEQSHKEQHDGLHRIQMLAPSA